MADQVIFNNLIQIIKPICRTDEELTGIPLYVKTDKYRQRIIDFLNIADEKGEYFFIE